MNKYRQASIYWIHLPGHTNINLEGYVGVSKNAIKRLIRHLTDVVNEDHVNPHLVNAIKKYTWGNLIKDIIVCGEETFCYELEASLRPTKNIGWNVAPGGNRGPGRPKGFKSSPQSIAKGNKTKLEKYGKLIAERKAKREAEKQERKLVRIKTREAYYESDDFKDYLWMSEQDWTNIKV